MTRTFAFRLLLFVAALMLPVEAWAQASAAAPAPAPSSATPQQARQLLDVLRDDTKRARLIATLQTMAQAPPPPAPAAAAPSSPVPLVRNSLGAQLLVQLSDGVERLGAEAAAVANSATRLPLLWRWLKSIWSDPTDRDALIEAAWKIALVMGVGLAIEWLVTLALRRSLRALAALAPESEEPAMAAAAAPRHRLAPGAWRRLRLLPFALARLLLDLLPVTAFAAAGNLLAPSLGLPTATRLAAVALVDAYVLTRAILCLVRMLVSPSMARLRLLHIDTAAASYVVAWVRRIVVVAVFGTVLAAIALLFGLDDSAHDALLRLVALVTALQLIIVAAQCRRNIAGYIRPASQEPGAFAGWRRWAAGAWHYFAIVAILAVWLIWAVGGRSGFDGLRALIGTVAVLIAARLLAIVALGTLERALHFDPQVAHRFPELEARASRYYRPARLVVLGVLAAITVVLLLQVWGVDALAWFEDGTIGRQLLAAVITITIAATAAAIAWEGANAALARRVARLSQGGRAGQAARLRTLLPILRTALLVVILIIVGLTALSEIGVDVAPLLAGAGIAGIAIGFGSQKLVQDVITGMFLLLENAVQVGDAVTVSGLSGNVEHLSVRTMWLRAGDGSVHIIPFGSVTSITNTNRGIGNAAIAVTVAYKEDTDRVGAVLKEVAAEMRRDPVFGPLMRGELELWGVDEVRASGVKLVGQIECTDSGRWAVQREFNRRMKKRFQELEIAIADLS